MERQDFKPSSRALFRALQRHEDAVYKDRFDEVYRIHETCAALSNAAYVRHGRERYRNGRWDAADPHVIAALRAALADHASDYAGQSIAYTLVRMGLDDAVLIDALHAWRRVAYRWADDGFTGACIVSKLNEAGMSAAASAQVVARLDGWIADPFSALDHDGELMQALFPDRIAFAALTDTGFQPRHDELIERLAAVAVPSLAIEGAMQAIDTADRFGAIDDAAVTRNDGSARTDVDGIEVVGDDGAHWAVHFRHAGVTRGFLARAQGSWLDVNAVVAAFDDLMRSVGRQERAFRFGDSPGGNGEYALFIVADGDRFADVAARLHIPLR